MNLIDLARIAERERERVEENALRIIYSMINVKLEMFKAKRININRLNLYYKLRNLYAALQIEI